MWLGEARDQILSFAGISSLNISDYPQQVTNSPSRQTDGKNTTNLPYLFLPIVVLVSNAKLLPIYIFFFFYFEKIGVGLNCLLSGGEILATTICCTGSEGNPLCSLKDVLFYLDSILPFSHSHWHCWWSGHFGDSPRAQLAKNFTLVLNHHHSSHIL